MKINYLILSIFFIFLLTSCSKEDNSLIGPPASNESEDLPLDANMVTSNFKILGATESSGTPPSANGNLDVTFSTEEQSAFLKTGFNLKFNTDATVAGAYLQILNEDGSKADKYFDIPSVGFTVGLTSSEDKKVKILNAKNGTGAAGIDVNFESDMTPGTFCLELCFYDEDGNISPPQEICVEVESWGGFDALVGDWSLVKYIDNGEETVAGETDCGELYEYSCYGEGTYMAAGIWGCEMEEMRFLMNTDGGFQYWYEEHNTYRDGEASDTACEPIYQDTWVSESYFEGKWAYDEEEQIMTMVLFNGVYAGNQQDYGDGELGYAGVTTASNNEMTINVFYEDFFSDETIEQLYYFSK